MVSPNLVMPCIKQQGTLKTMVQFTVSYVSPFRNGCKEICLSSIKNHDNFHYGYVEGMRMIYSQKIYCSVLLLLEHPVSSKSW